MALHGNRSTLLKSPGRFLNGGPSILRSNFGKHGMVRNSYETFAPTSAIPSGYYGGSGAWVQPKKGGAVSGVNAIVMAVNANGAGAMGKNTGGTISVALAIVGTAGLISSASGVAAISTSANANIFAAKFTSGVLSVNLGASGIAKGTGHTGGVAPVSFAAQWAPYAVGWVSGTTTNNTVLTVDAIVNALRAASETDPLWVDVRKVFGTQIQGAGTPGDPWGP